MSEPQNSIHIRVHEFFQQSEPVKDEHGKETGELVVRDYVKYGPPHAMDRQAVVARVERILKAVPPKDNNIAMKAAWERREFIRPLYEAWKRGEELPETGTPLAACNFLRANEVAVLKVSGIKTAEDLANLADRDMEAVKLPMMREKRVQAKRFLEAQDTNKAAAAMAARDARINEQAQELAELKAMIAAMAKPEEAPEVDENGDRIPKRRGRPPKAETHENEAA